MKRYISIGSVIQRTVFGPTHYLLPSTQEEALNEVESRDFPHLSEIEEGRAALDSQERESSPHLREMLALGFLEGVPDVGRSSFEGVPDLGSVLTE